MDIKEGKGMERQISTLFSKEVKLHKIQTYTEFFKQSGVLVRCMEVEVEEATEIRNQ